MEGWSPLCWKKDIGCAFWPEIRPVFGDAHGGMLSTWWKEMCSSRKPYHPPYRGLMRPTIWSTACAAVRIFISAI